MNKLIQLCLLFLLLGVSVQHNLQIGHSNQTQNNNTSLKLVVRRAITPLSDNGLIMQGSHHISKRASEFDNFVKGYSEGNKIGSVFGPIGGFVGGIIGGIFCLFTCKDEEPPNQPPSFTSCDGPPSKEYFAGLGTTSTAVTWNTPTASDPEDGSLSVNLVQGYAPGTTFDRGSHTIIYTASDSTGATTYCYFSFKVSVITCDPIQWPDKGDIYCDKSEYIYGSKCTVKCAEGYEMVPQPTSVPYQIMCDKSGTNQPILDKAVPRCEAITCPLNATELDMENGSPVCTHRNHKYDSSCTTQCDSGYGLSSGIIFSTCQEDKTWSTQLPNCQDNESPEITNCPQTVYAYTDKMSQTAVVSWTQPTATDNSGSATVTQTRGDPPGSNFRLGLTEIRYRATDANGNRSPECIFFINVEEIRCDPPLSTDKYLLYHCLDGYTYGSTCQLKCMGSFPLIGNDTITCERNDSFTPPRGYWDMGEFQPYCLKNPCDQLPAPENGAMVCDTWMFGLQCQMQCSAQFDIPFGTVGSNGAPFTGLYTCSESKGEYSPSNTVPGCTQLRRPGMTTVLGEFFYYTGDCNDPTVLGEIKDNFIQQMQLLEANGWNGLCPSQIDCNVNNTQVTCGAISGKKRDVNAVLEYFRDKRSTHEIRVEITLATSWYDFNSTGGTTFYFLEEVQKRVFNTMKASAMAGNLTVRGLSPDTNSFTLGYSNPDCPKGNIVRWSTLTCVPCSAGTYLDSTSDPMNPGCKDCPIGTYKEIPEDINCTPCPPGTSTGTTGSKNITSCLKKCRPGEFSQNGLEPCHLCPQSFYQNDDMSTTCLPCPFGKTTTYSGATGTHNCTNFDVKFSEARQKIEFDTVKSNQRVFSVSTWIFVPNTLANFSIFRSESSSIPIDVNYRNSLDIRINSQLMSTGVTVPRDTWSHVTIQIDSDSLVTSVHVDGSKVYSASISGSVSLASSLITQSSVISIMLNEASITGYLISGYHVEFSKLTDSEVATLASTCHGFRQNAFISMGTFINMSQVQAVIISPSVCDNINQCDPNPCNGHPCVDKINTYTCQCENSYTGEFCQNQPDYCRDNPCKNNGTCSNSGGNFTCSCPAAYKGDQCQYQIVNGGWSPWTSFSECSASCGGGIKTRYRLCNSPTPDPDGLPCDANGANETVPCKTDVCPSCLPLRKGFGNIANCTKHSDGHDVCTITCRPGYVFTAQNQPLPVYVCGPNTSYEWNGRPPSCGRANSPISISLVSSVQYNPEIPCTDAATASSKLKAELESSLPCAVNRSCSVNVTTPGCTTYGRRRRSTSSSQTITLTQTFVSGDNLNLEASQDSQNISTPLYDLLMGINSLEVSAQQINSTHSILQFEINGVQYSSTAVSTDSVVQCPSGQGRREALCVDCPLGTFSDSGTCKLCSVGTYQDESGQSACKSCPRGFTTMFEGSQNVTDCSESVTSTSSTSTITPASSTTDDTSSQTTDKTSFLPSTTTRRSVTTPSSDSDPTPKRKKDSSDILIIVAAVMAVLVFILVTAVVVILVCKQMKRTKFSQLSSESSSVRGSWASLSMVKPGLTFVENYNVPPASSVCPETMKYQYSNTSEL